MFLHHDETKVDQSESNPELFNILVGLLCVDFTLRHFVLKFAPSVARTTFPIILPERDYVTFGSLLSQIRLSSVGL